MIYNYLGVTPSTKLTEEDYNHIISTDIKVSSASIAKQYNMDPSYIGKLRKGTYKPKSFKPS